MLSVNDERYKGDIEKSVRWMLSVNEGSYEG